MGPLPEVPPHCSIRLRAPVQNHLEAVQRAEPTAVQHAHPAARRPLCPRCAVPESRTPFPPHLLRIPCPTPHPHHARRHRPPLPSPPHLHQARRHPRPRLCTATQVDSPVTPSRSPFPYFTYFLTPLDIIRIPSFLLSTPRPQPYIDSSYLPLRIPLPSPSENATYLRLPLCQLDTFLYSVKV
jgi:hypothetical protein